jgi:hypothetical protein
MHKQIIIAILCLSSIFAVDPIAYQATDFQGTQVIDSVLAYTHNMKYSHNSGRLWFIADKAIPNVYYAMNKGPTAKEFYVPVASPLNLTDSSPYLAYDVMNFGGVDYIIGTTYGSWKTNNFGLGIQVSSSDTTDRKVRKANVNNCFFFGVHVDPNTATVTNTYNIYLVGHCFGNDKNRDKGLAVSRATIQFGGDLPVIWKEEDVYILESKCYDVWTETHRPTLHLHKESGTEFLYVTIPGKCSAIYKLELSDSSPFAPRLNNSYNFNSDPDLKDVKIISSVINSDMKKMYVSAKKYNVDMSYLLVISTMTLRKIDSLVLLANESTPVLALDAAKDIVYVATAGFDKIYKYSNLRTLGIAVLPSVLKSVSSMYYVNGTIYIVTFEPNAEIGRISEKNFCDNYCSIHGYCNAGVCACIKDYDKDPVKQTFVCAPTHYIQNQYVVQSEQGAAAAFGVLFVISIIAGVLGWFLWFRGQSSFSKI